MAGTSVQPVELVHHQASGQLALRWDDGLQVSLPSQALRRACRCGACEKLRRAGRGPVASPDTRLIEVRPVGAFGVQLCFDDGHDRGIYPWLYLHELSLLEPTETGS